MIKNRIKHLRNVLKRVDDESIESIENIADIIASSFLNGGKLLIAGNGGSSSQSQHIAGEFVGKFYLNRSPLPAIALSDSQSSLTAIGNDYGYKHTFSRQVEAFGNSKDVLLLLSTSGKSKNIIEAAYMAQNLGMTTFAMTGNDTTELHLITDDSILVPSTDTARIQECHILFGHIIAEIVEETIFNDR